MKRRKRKKGGFTIIELMVSMTLFIVVSLISVGALLSIVSADKKAQSLKSVVNNLNFAIESVSKSVRVGSSYHCRDIVGANVPAPSALDSPRDCSSGGNLIAYEASGGDRDDPNDNVVYWQEGDQIMRSIDGGASFVGLTAPEVVITGLRFHVLNTSTSDSLQPRVVIIIRGTVDLGQKATTKFNIQTSVSQREIDG